MPLDGDFGLQPRGPLAGDPGPGDPALGLPEVARGTAYAAEQVLVALPRIAIYGLLASAYALVFGLVGRINLAFGELAAIGAAATGLVVAALPPCHVPQAIERHCLAVLVAIAPVVGSARVTAAAGAIIRGILGAEALEQSVPEQRQG